MNILIGLFGVITGLAIIKYREPVYRFFGKFDFAEKFLGAGGSLNFYILFGSFLVVISILYASGFLQNLVYNLFSKFF